MGHFGFSYMGLLFLAALFLPNFLWVKRQPKGYSAEGENPVLQLLERVGQVLVTGIALLFSDFNYQGWSLWNLWLAAAVGCMALYELWWVRYFRSRRRLEDFYSSMMGIPLPGAVLPVMAFLFLGIYGRVIWMVLAAVILGVGHIGIHRQHSRKI